MPEVSRTPAYLARAALAGEAICVQQCLVGPACSLYVGPKWALAMYLGTCCSGLAGTLWRWIGMEKMVLTGSFDPGEFPGEFPQLPDFSMQALSLVVQNMVLWGINLCVSDMCCVVLGSQLELDKFFWHLGPGLMGWSRSGQGGQAPVVMSYIPACSLCSETKGSGQCSWKHTVLVSQVGQSTQIELPPTPPRSRDYKQWCCPAPLAAAGGLLWLPAFPS